MVTITDLEFINRDSELALLDSYLKRRQGEMPAAIVIRSSPGVGKSRLTDRLCLNSTVPDLIFCIVDPLSQNSDSSVRVYDGFFVQRCAEQLTYMAESLGYHWASLKDFLNSRITKTLREKKPKDLVAEMPGPRSAYKIISDYISRVFSIGNFSPKELLENDQGYAVRICEEYVESVLGLNPIVLIVREAQLCDQRSLRTFVRWTESLEKFDLIIEYTSRNCEFDYIHQKLLYPLTGPAKYFYVLDLVRLDAGHLEHLIRMNVRSDFSVEADAYMKWDGNLRSIIEMQFQVTIGHKLLDSNRVSAILCDLSKSIEEHIDSLSSLHRIILAFCAAHIEPIDEKVLAESLMSFAPATSPLLLRKALFELSEHHRFLVRRDDGYRIHNETVADAMLGVASIKMLLAAAEKALRDHYSMLVSNTDFRIVSMAAARQFFRLCARTNDVVGLLRSAETLGKNIALVQDPSFYTELITTTVSSNPMLYGDSKEQLLQWAGKLAYDAGNFEQANVLLSKLTSPDIICLTMLAFSKCETGGHEDGLRIAERLQHCVSQYQTQLVAELIKGLIAGCRGEHEKAHQLLIAAVENPVYSNSPLLGYAHRFFECIEDYAGCIDNLYKSIAIFDHFGLQRSKAYSQVALAVLSARLGNFVVARPMIEEAAAFLDIKAPGRHLLLNNMAALDLLSDNPDSEICKRLLSDALRCVQDDYSEIVILSNLSLAHWRAQELGQAMDCVEKVLRILESHNFASQEIYWPLCFNAALIMRNIGANERAEELLQLPIKRCKQPVLNREYWEFRYGQRIDIDDSYHFLAGRPYHPLYLSLWVIESDCLSLLMQESLQ